MRKVFIEGEGYRESTRQSGLAEAFVDKVLCVAIRTDVYAAVLISVVATLAARWGTTGWSAYPPRRKTPQGVPAAAVARRQRPCYWGGAPECPPSPPQPPPRTTQCLDTLAPPAWPVPLAIVIVVIRQCRTLAITQNSIVVQLMEWPVLTIVVWSTIVQCHRQSGLRLGLLVTLRYRIRLRRRRRETKSRITSTIVAAAVVVAGAQRNTKMAVERGSHCGSCETFLMDTCELHSN